MIRDTQNVMYCRSLVNNPVSSPQHFIQSPPASFRILKAALHKIILNGYACRGFTILPKPVINKDLSAYAKYYGYPNTMIQYIIRT